MLKLLDYVARTEVEEDPIVQSVRLSTGEEVQIEEGSAPAMRLLSSRGELLLEYNAETHQTRVAVPEGDLCFDVKKGNIDLSAAGRVRLAGQHSVSLESGEAGAKDRATVDVSRRGLELTGDLVAITGRRGRMILDELRYAGNRFRGTLSEARVGLDKLDVVAKRMRSRVGTALLRVEGLLQTRAGRLRSVVEKSLHLRSRKISMYADKDVTIDGSQINLG